MSVKESSDYFLGFNPDFKFDINLPSNKNEKMGILDKVTDVIGSGHRTVDDLIAHHRFKKSNQAKTVEDDIDDEREIEIEDITSDEEVEIKDVVRAKENGKSKKSKKKANSDDEEDKIEKYQFGEEVTKYKDMSSFIDMKLSKPLLKALTDMQLEKPTAIQSACIPVSLLNRDICACARTGSGKTAAFLIPVIERLIHRAPSPRSETRALIMSPTRELAVQIYSVALQLLKYCPRIRVQLSTGGLDQKGQAATLRHSPDIVVATPGRLIDHLHNAPVFNLQNVEFLVLDEADKMLDEYFAEQIKEVIRMCNINRQSMLLSATMTEDVKELAAVSLKNPVKIFINQNHDMAAGLQQEFCRVRPQREEDREAMLTSLLVRAFSTRTIVFLPTKRCCHRLHILLGLLGLRCAELHGNMTQAQRLESLAKFSETREADVLLATDLAARGLDIVDVNTVINFNLPATLKQYIHRVGRTARAGKNGRAVSLVGEAERKVLKQIVKQGPVKARTINSTVIEKYRQKIADLETDVAEILEREKEEREARLAEQQLAKVQNELKHKTSDEAPTSMRRRVNWFKEKQAEQKKLEASLKSQKKEKNMKRKRDDNDSSDEDVASQLTRRDKKNAHISRHDQKQNHKKSRNSKK